MGLVRIRENGEKIMKKVMLITLAVVIYALCLAGCSPYASKYNAVALVRTTTDDSAEMTFSEFDGTMVFKLDNKLGENAKLSYSTKLKGGSANIYYDHDRTKRKLISAVEGEQTKGSAEGLKNETVYVIVETNKKCENGDFSFEIQQ